MQRTPWVRWSSGGGGGGGGAARGLRLLLAALCCCCLLLTASASPANVRAAGNPQAMETMRHIPQWHCLRYRRFDLVKRCRNYRGGRRH